MWSHYVSLTCWLWRSLQQLASPEARPKLLRQKSQVKHGTAARIACNHWVPLVFILCLRHIHHQLQGRPFSIAGGVGGCNSTGCSIAYKAVLRNWLHSNRGVHWASRHLWHFEYHFAMPQIYLELRKLGFQTSFSSYFLDLSGILMVSIFIYIHTYSMFILYHITIIIIVIITVE